MYISMYLGVYLSTCRCFGTLGALAWMVRTMSESRSLVSRSVDKAASETSAAYPWSTLGV